jgi:hypothetical protein
MMLSVIFFFLKTLQTPFLHYFKESMLFLNTVSSDNKLGFRVGGFENDHIKLIRNLKMFSKTDKNFE